MSWTHVELGAGNYGMKVLYLDDVGWIEPDRQGRQLSILYQTLDQVILERGLKGTFYVNDLEEEVTNFAVQHLNRYLNTAYQKHSVQVKALAGNYCKIALPECDSMHLKNPAGPDLEKLFSDVMRVAQMVSRSKTGLVVDTYYTKETCFTEFYEDGIYPLRLKGKRPEYILGNREPFVHENGPVRRFIVQRWPKPFSSL